MTTAQTTTVRFGRLERRGLLLGLSAVQLGLVGAALILVVSAGLAAGPVGVLLTAPAWAAALAWAVVPVGGRPAVEVTPTASAWLFRRATGTSTVLARPRRDRAESLAIPGVAGRLRIDTDERTGAALIRSARGVSAPVTVVADVRGRGFLLQDDSAQERLVAGWGRLLASLPQLAGVTGVQVLHRCAPSDGAELQQWWSAQASGGTTWLNAVAAGLASDNTNATSIQTRLAIAYRPGRGKDSDAILTSLTDAIAAAELDVHQWLTPHQVQRWVRATYDPAAPSEIPSSSTAFGPMGVAESWNHVQTDSGFHAVYWIGEWPRSATHPGFLRSVLLGPGARRTLSLLATPLPPGKALREIRRARAEQTADAMTRARIGRVEDEITRAASAELHRREEDLVAGHGDLRFTGLLAVTATSLDDLAEEAAAAEIAAAQAGCELRRLVGQQVQAFAAAALPFARVLP